MQKECTYTLKQVKFRGSISGGGGGGGYTRGVKVGFYSISLTLIIDYCLLKGVSIMLVCIDHIP